MGWPLMIALMAGQIGVTELIRMLAPMSGKEKELLELQLTGAKEASGRETEAMRQLQEGKANSDFRSLLLQLGMGQAAERGAVRREITDVKAEAGQMQGAADAISATDPTNARVSSMMTQPATFKSLLGLEG